MAKKGGSKTTVEYDYHVVGVRMRITGAGNMNLTLAGLDNVVTQTLVPVPMAANNRLEPTRLSNIQGQRIRLQGNTTELNETFLIRRIILYAKPVATEYPGGGL